MKHARYQSLPENFSGSLNIIPALSIKHYLPAGQWNARAKVYLLLTAILLAGYIAATYLSWHGSMELHTVMEVAATLVAAFSGMMMMAIYLAQRKIACLFLGTGLLCTAALDGYHAVVTSIWFGYLWPSPPASLIPWSWNASRLCLALLIFLSWYLLNGRRGHDGPSDHYSLPRLLFCTGIITLGCLLLFAFVPLPQAYFPQLMFPRPQEFVAGAVFLVTLIGLLRQGNWQAGGFAHWLIIALIINTLTQVPFMASSQHLFDGMFNLAHLLKLTGYLCLGIGVWIENYHLNIYTKAIEQVHTRYTEIVSSGPVVIYATTAGDDYRCIFVSENLNGIMGYAPAEMIDDPRFWHERIHPEDRQRVYREWKRCKKRGRGILEYRFRHRDGHYLWVNDNFRILYRDGAAAEVVGSWTDITPNRKLAEALNYQSSHDALTGLVNRAEFENRLQQAIAITRMDRVEHTLCYLDIDLFKVINDTCGHVAGDQLIRKFADIMGSGLRRSDTLGRVGGDEFGIVIQHCRLGDSRRFVNALLDSVRSQSFVWQGKLFPIHASMGAVAVNEQAQDAASLIQMASELCCLAREAGGDRVYYYDDSASELARHRGEKYRVAQIKHALEKGSFELHAQIIKPLRTNGKGRHFEVLVRMLDDSGQPVLPGTFLPVAEKYNLVHRIDTWVIKTILRWLKENPGNLVNIDICAINLSSQSMTIPELLDLIGTSLEEYHIPPEKICFEVTETSAIANLSNALQFIEQLRAAGCRFSLDDFGTGFSSFAYLQTLPVDYLKIDGSFVKDIDENPVNLAMVRSINELGHVTGKKTIAEFVENARTLNRLDELGVDYVQGYGIARPRPLQTLDFSSPAD